MTIFKIIQQANMTEDVLFAISEWHDECEAGCNGECEIYDALANGANDEELITIAYDVDADLFDRFNLDLSAI